MNKKILYIISLMIIFLGCKKYNSNLNYIQKNYDKFSDIKTKYVEFTPYENDLPGDVKFKFSLEKSKSNESFKLKITYSDKNWLFINKIIFLLNDKKKIELYKYHSNNNASSYVTEHVYFSIKAKQIKEIAMSNKVEYRLSGKYIKDHKFEKDDILILRQFYNKVVKNKI